MNCGVIMGRVQETGLSHPSLHTQPTLTFNLKDSPAEQLAPHEIKAQHPGEFISHLLNLNLSAGLAPFARHSQTLKNPPKTVNTWISCCSKACQTPCASCGHARRRFDFLYSISEAKLFEKSFLA
ncbi:hypothetical protein BI347_07960 [Chromobacterium sphagni]|uniref:Uncharacterized protein n=1 Tax=Chromobacterium sphagni TaxID=1903179 RepID=A0A1S1X2M3_9NEIS|nr:hypothetical protein [Chromobacterium sphagni]OHX13456.1 hypothetical protein BI347_07960 [Chromobacterium sphagni]